MSRISSGVKRLVDLEGKIYPYTDIAGLLSLLLVCKMATRDIVTGSLTKMLDMFLVKGGHSALKMYNNLKYIVNLLKIKKI